jgi:CBS-domain-containing membrane protein
MTNAVIQRLVVVDAARRPTGIVSMTDLVAALAAADEDEQPRQSQMTSSRSTL